MTVLIDDTLATSMVTMPVREGWVETPDGVEVRVVAGLTSTDVTMDDVALLPAAAATALVHTHVVDRSVGVVHDGIGMTTMWTPVRADEIDGVPVAMVGVGIAGETLVRALLRPYFGITPTGLTNAIAPPEDARVVIHDGVRALMAPPEEGYREDLVRNWRIMTGFPFVSHVTVVGVRALARDADAQFDALRAIVAAGHERRRDVRRVLHETLGIDREILVAVTGAMRYALTPEDVMPARRLVEMGTWETRWGRSLPAWRDQIDEVRDEGSRITLDVHPDEEAADDA